MASRIIVWCTLIGVIAYDIPTAYFGRTTISEAIRQVDAEVNGLLRWGMLALWLHFFFRYK
jgi:hypothetical protein